MKVRYIIVALFVTTMFLSCDEDILEQKNPNQVTVEDYYKTPAQLTAATNGVYSELLGNNLWGRMLQYFEDCRADEHAAGGGQIEGNNRQLLDGTYDNSNSTINPVWRGLYRVIHRANAVIQYAPSIKDIDPVLLKQRVGEAKFLRAWSYYMLVAHWGKVPIYTQPTSSPSDAKPLSEEAEVYTLLETDLGAIISEDALPKTYSSADDKGRATKGAAQLLLARVLMHEGKYAEAKPILESIYSSGTYKLMNNYSDNFREETEYNAESIFEIGFTGNGYGWSDDNNSTSNRATIMFQDYNPVGWRNCIPSDKLLDEYERPYKGDPKEDPRMRETVYFTGDTYGSPTDPKILTDDKQNGFASKYNGTVIKTGWKKWSPMYKLDPGGYWPSAINYRHMRFAEVILKLAECENEVGTPAKAISYLNEIRDRASVSMEHYPTSRFACNSKDQIYRAIMHEGMVEFANEHIRVLDLIRWRKNGKFNATNPEPIAYIASDPSKALLVLPLEETSRNTNIIK